MKHRKLLYAVLPAVLGLGFLGVNVASGHGFFGGVMGSQLSAEEIATRQQTMFDRQAQVLGISVDEAKAAWAEGKSMKQIIQEKGLDTTQIHARMKDAHLDEMKTHLQSLVDKGIVTQTQADRRLQVMQERMQNGKDRMMMKHKGMLFF